MNLATANGKIFLLYKHAEDQNLKKIRKQLAANGIIAIPCEDPANFRFVAPEIVRALPEELDLIGRLALKHLGTGYSSSAADKFVQDLRAELCESKKKDEAAQGVSRP